MKIVGLDVCKSSVVACLLTERPSEPRKFYYEAKFYEFKADASGIKGLLELEPDLAVMEPTGVNYSRLWGTHLARAGIELRLVGHTQLRAYRANHLELPDKDDQADALALACYCWDYLENPRKFLQIRDRTIVAMRSLVLRLAHLNRVQSPLINRIRQDLSWQFPEVAEVKSPRYNGNVPLLWGWLAGERESKKYDLALAKSVGLGLRKTVAQHAKRLCDLQKEEIEIENQLAVLMEDSRFDRYHKIFNRFGFGDRVAPPILSQIYPFENFLKDGKPEVKIRKGRKSGKPTKRYLSRRRFEKALGVAPTEESSGIKSGKNIVGGSDLCRKALWQWIFTRLEPKKCRPDNEIARVLGEYLDSAKSGGQPVKLVRMKCAAKAARLLFKELALENPLKVF